MRCMARLTRLQVTNYRSIGVGTEVIFRPNIPVVLIGENNAGKSNLVRALNLILGARWPGNLEPDDNEFHGRERDKAIEIVVDFDEHDPLGGRFTQLTWRYDPRSEAKPVSFNGQELNGRPDAWPRQEERDTCTCVVLEADRNLSYHLGYSSKWTMLSRLMHRFHRALTRDAKTRGELEGLFGQVKTAFGHVPEFAEFTGTLKGQLEGMLSSMTHRLEVDFEAYNPSNFFHALRLQAAEGATPRAFEEMGTGEQQVLAMAFAYAYAHAFHGGILLAIEEPEAHLHPLAQTWLARRLHDMAGGGLQVLLSTHSPAFVNLLDLEGLALVRKPRAGSEVVQRTRFELVTHCEAMGAKQASVGNILPFYAAHATRDILEGFFAKEVVLVEGPTEAFALPVYLEKVGLSCAKEGIAIIPVGGKGQLGKWYRLFTDFEVPTYVIFDNDPKHDGKTAKREDVLTALGVERGRWPALLAADQFEITESLAVFGKDFEVTMRALFPAYVGLEECARAQGLDPESKPLLARWVAEHMEHDPMASGWMKMDEIARQLRQLVEIASGEAPMPEVEEAPPVEDPDDDIPF